MGYAAADRYRYGMVAEMSMSENMLLKSSYLNKWVNHGLIRWSTLHRYTEDSIKQYAIKHRITRLRREVSLVEISRKWL